MAAPRLRIGFVREHFCSPLLQLAAKNSSIELVECPSGTGQVMTRLKNNEIDVAIALTESLIAGIAKKTAEFKLVGTYVTSPLNWAVIVGKCQGVEVSEARRSTGREDRHLQDRKRQSGHGVGHGAERGLGRRGRKGRADRVRGSRHVQEPPRRSERRQGGSIHVGALHDEGKATTLSLSLCCSARTYAVRGIIQPYLNEVRFIDYVPTPWHSWAIVASPATLSSSSPLLPTLQSFLPDLSASMHAFDSPAARASDSVEFIKAQFGYPEEDVRAWLDQVAYPKGEAHEVSRAMVERTLDTLVKAGVLDPPEGGWRLEDFVDTSVAKWV
ncbi:SPOSA6832_02757, partial [Sporobolomyces salmonicolor]